MRHLRATARGGAATRALCGVAAGLAAAAALAACEPSRPNYETRLGSENYLFTITWEPMPAYARERTRYRILVRDAETRQPIEGGEGRIFFTNQDGATVWDGLAAGEAPGVYTGTVTFVTAGNWAAAVQFRRDPGAPLERADWMQDIRPERPLEQQLRDTTALPVAPPPGARPDTAAPSPPSP